MPEMYVDLEVAYTDPHLIELLKKGVRTPSPTPDNCKIITMQYQFLDEEGHPKGDLQIFKEWESSEESIMKKAWSLINPNTKWDIIPVGQNLSFDLGMLRGRAAHYGIHYSEWFMYNELPVIDTKAILLGMNAFMFKGSGLDKFTGKESSGAGVLLWYANQEYDKILEYIKRETREFIAFYAQLKKALPEFRKREGFGKQEEEK